MPRTCAGRSSYSRKRLVTYAEVQIEQLRKLAPLERLGQPDDIANVVSFLAGPDGGWVNSQVLRANGGFA